MRIVSLAALAGLLCPLAFAQESIASSAPEAVQEFGYESDAARLLQVVSGALYHDKSAFIRELVSNAADALEKYRMLRLTEGLQDDTPLNVTIRPYKDERTLVITDSGVGMTKAELRQNLGTIAKSGTTEFLDKVTSSSGDQASALIGRFGMHNEQSPLVTAE